MKEQDIQSICAKYGCSRNQAHLYDIKETVVKEEPIKVNKKVKK